GEPVEPLSLEATAIELSRPLWRFPRAGTAGDHRILGCEPAFSSSNEKWRNRRFDAARAKHSSLAHLHEHASGRLGGVGALEAQRPQFIRRASIGSHVCHVLIGPPASGLRRNQRLHTGSIRLLNRGPATSIAPAWPKAT